ncbi:MAG TPA: LamG-like jellyroll fold domain-containing protein [Pirellulaceae bacterium]|nr:LamG-like jellyroll fold domain-containing protein [Pirellulaceae bacterium]
MHRSIRNSICSCVVFFCLFSVSSVRDLRAEDPVTVEAIRWWEGYKGVEANGPDVLGFWKFDGDEATFSADSSSHGHLATMRGAKQNKNGRFGKCLESFAGYPVVDESHGLHISQSSVLSAIGPFTVELWARAKDKDDFPDTIRPVLLDMKYVAYNHTGFMLSLTRGGAEGTRRLTVQLGTGAASHNWYSQPFALKPEIWRHLAFTYDARGTVAFFVDGDEVGSSTEVAVGPMAVAVRPLSIGDRIGSLYNGFPGFIDEVRITKGLREFRPIRFIPETQRFVIVRMSDGANLTADLLNQTGTALEGVTVTAEKPDGATQQSTIPYLAKAASHRVEFSLPSSLKPGSYAVTLLVELPNWGGARNGYRSTTEIPFVITRRPLPQRMPVVMWGIGGTDGVVREIPRLKQIGFTHCLGLRCDYQKVWDEGVDAMPSTADTIRASREMLNAALENDLQVVASLSPGRWLRTAEVGRPFIRIDRKGSHYGREDISGTFPKVRDFCFNTGAAMGRAYGNHPAFASALLHTEVRGESQVSFHPIEVEAYRKETGAEIPSEVTIKNGVQWQNLKELPKNRVISDDDPILRYLSWFWKEGDGWNDLNTRLHEGLHQHISHDSFWSFHDPAVRVPSMGGSGGKSDILAHWTYSYPDPVRIGLCTDELFEMARVNGHGQDVMKMTQLIWYRSQTAPKNAAPVSETSPWVDQDPDADYITIAPMHLREAFWWKIARPIKGIMYHGWQSLVETDSPSAYRYTNPNTQHELQRLIKNVVEPLGPTLMQIPDANSDVAFLESFTSQMFARRGTYGWNHTWAGDMYHVLMYAQLQPRVLYTESLLKGGLDGAKVLVMADCDVLTESVVGRIQRFQANGGLVIGDAEVCPAIKPDFILARFSRTKKAFEDRASLLNAAGELRQWLDSRYSRTVDSSNRDVVTRRRRFGTTDYIFAVNDCREPGTYVGGYGMVMEDGLPSETTIRLKRESGFVYDLLKGRALSAKVMDNAMIVPLQLGSCEGQILMVTDRPIQEVKITAPKEVTQGERINIDIAVTDGNQVVDAVVPIEVRIADPEGSEAEFTGHYGAKAGRQSITFDVAPNDRPGVWAINVRELASGKSTAAYVRVRATE